MQLILLCGTLEYKVRDLEIPLCCKQPLQVCVCVLQKLDLSLLITLSLLFFSNYGHSYPLLYINTFPLPCLQVTHIDD